MLFSELEKFITDKSNIIQQFTNSTNTLYIKYKH